MKKVLSLFLVLVVLLSFAMFALGSSSEEEKVDQGSGSATQQQEDDSNLGDYNVEIKSCRLAKDYEGKDVVIVTYVFANVKADEAASFYVTFEDTVYQNGVGLNEAYVLADDANYSEDNQTKEIKKGASIEVEVAYELNDTETDIEVEVEELFSFEDKVLTKTFSISK